MTTVNNMSKSDNISLLFAGREYINLLGGENKFKIRLTKKMRQDKQSISELVNIMVKTPPSYYLYFSYRGEHGKEIEGIRFYYLIDHPATTKLHIYRKTTEDPLNNNCLKKCYVIVEYKKKPNARFLVISAATQKGEVDIFNDAYVEAFDGHHIE
ncbi:MAG: hypothetical protein LBJ89_02670 [Holosporales bacterium]|jgi:hypothetical protein|nr:hypothetical protein [Holosporales bacterium]